MFHASIDRVFLDLNSADMIDLHVRPLPPQRPVQRALYYIANCAWTKAPIVWLGTVCSGKRPSEERVACAKGGHSSYPAGPVRRGRAVRSSAPDMPPARRFSPLLVGDNQVVEPYVALRLCLCEYPAKAIAAIRVPPLNKGST